MAHLGEGQRIIPNRHSRVIITECMVRVEGFVVVPGVKVDEANRQILRWAMLRLIEVARDGYYQVDGDKE